MASKRSLRKRVIATAIEVLRDQDEVGFLDVLSRMAWLQSAHVESWKHQRYPEAERLENLMQSTSDKRMKALYYFEEWGDGEKLSSISREYYPTTRRSDAEELLITVDGDPDLERRYRRVFVRRGVSPKRREILKQRATKRPDLLVFVNFREQTCAECDSTISDGDFTFLEKGNPVCLACAELDHLEFLPSGDVAMTRRAKKHSPIWAIVLKFNRRRRRQERQGLLVTPAAIEAAEEACLNDADQRAASRARAEKRRQLMDSQLATDMARRISRLFPGCPKDEAMAIAAHACVRHSGRIGRSEAGRNLDDRAVRLAVVAHVRHTHTNYDSLLMAGCDREEARRRIAPAVDDVLEKWSGI